MTLLKRISQRLLEHTSVMPYYWVILFVATGSQVTISFVNQGIATLAPFFVRDLGLNMTQVGFLCGAVNIGMAFTLLLVGVLVDRFGEKVVLIAGGILTGLTMLAASRANSFAALAVLLLIAGFWVASATPAGSKGIMSWFPVNGWGFALGFRQTGVPLGGALAALVLPALAMLYGWRAAVFSAGVFAIGGALFVLILYRESPGLSVQVGEDNHVHHNRHSSLRGLLRMHDIWLISFTALIMVGIQYTVLSYLELFYHDGLGYSIRFASYMLSLAQIAGAVSRVFWGIISDTLFHGLRKRPFLLVATFVTAMCLAMYFLRPGSPWWLLAALSFMAGFTAIGWNGLFIAMISELAGKDLAGTALGIALTVIQFGVLVIPPFFGFVVDCTGSYQTGWLTLFGFSLAGVFLLGQVREKKTEKAG